MRALTLLLLLATSAFAQRPTGTFTFKGNWTPIPTVFTVAQKWQADLPDVPHTAGGGLCKVYFAFPAGQPIGVVAHFGGHDGSGRFAQSSATLRDQYYRNLLSRGYVVTEVQWMGGGWIHAAPGRIDGMARLAGRPATYINWLHDGANSPVRGLPIKLVGISGGACQIAYALAFYQGVASNTVAAFPVSSMPFDEQCRGCTGDYDYSERGFIAATEGHALTRATDPCVLGDRSWCSFWDANSVSGGNAYFYPTTRVVMIEGAHDSPDITSRAAHYQGVLVNAGQPVERYNIPTMGHTLNADGFNVLLQEVTQ